MISIKVILFLCIFWRVYNCAAKCSLKETSKFEDCCTIKRILFTPKFMTQLDL